ncbi:hypothetical protein SAMN06295926_106156 [Lysinibacillus sp. AC-3]|nr:hypothetical protein SAMN06295926_106156 [Lysinibacillus sp. AC-3]
MFIDSHKKFIQMNGTGEAYTIKNDNNFFGILENGAEPFYISF